MIFKSVNSMNPNTQSINTQLLVYNLFLKKILLIRETLQPNFRTLLII